MERKWYSEDIKRIEPIPGIGGYYNRPPSPSNNTKTMNKPFKPAGYNSVSPYFIVNGAQRLIDLLKKIFDATELRRYDMRDGSIIHAEIQLDDSVIMPGDASDKYPPVSGDTCVCT